MALRPKDLQVLARAEPSNTEEQASTQSQALFELGVGERLCKQG